MATIGPIGSRRNENSKLSYRIADTQKLLARARRVRLLVLDVDGVLTDGRIVLTEDGRQTKCFDVRDGFGLVLAKQAGWKLALITAERSGTVTHRARRLKVDWVAQYARDKRLALERCLKHFRVPLEAVAYVGDDLLDLPVLKRVGFSAAPADAEDLVKRHVHYVTRAKGGRGAVREIVEVLLKAQGRWEELVERRYLS
jgi:3-deoxy-D-manno-octulosonate 8-phosphate phosphatase (KDO 8-P phosphatase)